MRDRLEQPGVVSIPAFAAFPWLRAGFSKRKGGASTVYGGGDLNLGWTAEDDPEIVAQNRQRFMRVVAGESEFELAGVRQIHGDVVPIIENDHAPLATADGKAVLQGDGLMTDVPGILLGIQTADCIPVLIVDPRTRAVAAFHAGWRGTVAGIVEKGVGAMKDRYSSRPENLIAAIGPGIGVCCYAVGEEVRSGFEGKFAYAAELFTEVGPQIHIDLWEANRRQLLDAGLLAENITVIGECTGCTREENGARRYFSHRMEHGHTGRMMAVIGVATR